MFGKVSRAKDYACIEVEGSRDPLQASLIIFTKGANNSDHDCKNENLYVRSHMTYQNVRSHLHA